MSTEAENSTVKIMIDGKELEVPQGSMIIEAADNAGIVIPRFCYHKKLSIAANCRMCLVEIENGRKPMPACASPVSDGMKVFTKSKKTIEFQKAVMEFLLINHPLDCPICDQGGECELQDVAMGYGNDETHYEQKKRVVKDYDIGPLIATDLTRCIHCTRCVRFGIEIAGMREIGMTSRGEHSEIRTFLHGSVESEMSGNAIDLCPVGALTSKPFRYQARAWEMQQHPSIAPHDCIGSNIYLHVRDNTVMRVVPRENEGINEVWLSDRDRFSYQGLNSESRLRHPMVKRDGEWEKVSWEEAFESIIKRLNRVKDKHGVDKFGAIASSSSTTEELYLLQKLFRSFDCHNIDHRIKQHDFNHQGWEQLTPGINCSLAEIENADVIWALAGDFRRQYPIIHHRIRKSTHNYSTVCVTNPADFELRFKKTVEQYVNVDDILISIAAVVKALIAKKKEQAIVTESFIKLLDEVEADANSEAIAEHLLNAENPVVIAGELVNNHPQASTMIALLHMVFELTQAKGGVLTAGANTAGAWLSGAVPHRAAAGARVERKGLNALQMLTEAELKAFVLLNTEPDLDSDYGKLALESLEDAECVIALTSFATENLSHYADVMLPIAAFAETSGTYINAMGDWQTFRAVTTPTGEARPAWKVLRVIANFMELAGFEYNCSSEVLAELKAELEQTEFKAEFWRAPKVLPKLQRMAKRIAITPMYQVDTLVRHAEALQQTKVAKQQQQVIISKTMADKLKVKTGGVVNVQQNYGDSVEMTVFVNDNMPDKNVFVPNGTIDATMIGRGFEKISLVKV